VLESDSSGSSAIEVWEWLLGMVLLCCCVGLCSYLCLKHHDKPARSKITPRKKKGSTSKDKDKSAKTANSAPSEEDNPFLDPEKGHKANEDSGYHGDSKHPYNDARSSKQDADPLLAAWRSPVPGPYEGVSPYLSNVGNTTPHAYHPASSSAAGTPIAWGHTDPNNLFGISRPLDTSARSATGSKSKDGKSDTAQDSRRGQGASTSHHGTDPEQVIAGWNAPSSSSQLFKGTSWEQSGRIGDPGYVVPAGSRDRRPEDFGTHAPVVSPSTMLSTTSYAPSIPQNVLSAPGRSSGILQPPVAVATTQLPSSRVVEVVERIVEPVIVERIIEPAVPAYVVEYVAAAPTPPPTTVSYIIKEPATMAPGGVL